MMSYSESAYERYNKVRALAARAAGEFPSSNNLRLQKPRASSIRSRNRELRGWDEGSLVDPTHPTGELDCLFGPTRRTGELDDLLVSTRRTGELDVLFGPTRRTGDLDDSAL
ncbi:hypothetical protein F2Q69_00013643 [Brassica cretica]|uniref:Uncharacterized protein n=1 Tax=Brassica cretica TaxID=69181 RepID=A0A8S9R0B2_BRACR|nr:hypothetical protein F2Q69_00013643 [Brassica cretica]